MKRFLSEFKVSVVLSFVLLVVVSGAYPVLVWAGGRLLFPRQADGSLIRDGQGNVVGSALIGQNFSAARYFQPRPSAAGNGYDPTSSGGTNYGPTSAKLAHGSHAKDKAGKPIDDPSNFDGISDLVAAYRSANGLGPNDPVPADAVTRSASGLDPDISVDNAEIQAARVARARRLPVEAVRKLVEAHVQDRDLGVFGEPRVNVLLLNLALDEAGH